MTTRVAVIDALRTPFTKRGGSLSGLSPVDLGRLVVSELVDRNDLDPSSIDQVVFGQVIINTSIPNIAREVVLGTGLPPTVDAHSISKACITSYQTAVSAAQAIRDSQIEVAIAGGVDSASHVPVMVSDALSAALNQSSGARSLAERVKAFRNVSPADLMPRPPDLTEPSTQETMGEGAERMAKINHIPRSEQDDFAHRSHVLAARAWEENRFGGQVMDVHLPPNYQTTVSRDETVRFNSERSAYDPLPPVFDRRHGTITAGNSSPLTDGAAALLLMGEDRAKAEGFEPLGYLRSSAFTAIDPADQLLMGPLTATPLALAGAGVSLADLDLIDMHEAFAAQVLSVLGAFESKEYAHRYLGTDVPLGSIDPEILNVNGGSIALGHPFGATGARQIGQTLFELRRRGGELALVTACAAGGLGAAMILEAV